LETDDVDRDDARYRASGIEFVCEPKTEDYRTMAVFKDPYGNGWDLIERRTIDHS
jgi:uncharacterized glyoxalase superfamily protein PhnB